MKCPGGQGGDFWKNLKGVSAVAAEVLSRRLGARGKARRKPAVDADAFNWSCVAASDDHHLIGTPHTALASQGKH